MDIDQAHFQFNQPAVFAVMVAFLVFAISLDLRWDDFRRVLKIPKAPLIGLVGQLVIMPAVAFALGMSLTDRPSVALGLLLVAVCPGGALSNYLTALAKGDVATSISMSAATTVVSVVTTPLLFGLWASLNPGTKDMLADIGVDPKGIVMALVVMLLVPVTLGMLIRAKKPDLADKIRVWVRRISLLVFAVVVAILLAKNMKVLRDYAGEALLPVAATLVAGVALGWALGRLVRLTAAERRAVAMEVGIQNVALAIGIALAIYPSATGVAVTAVIWGVAQIVGGVLLAGVWSRMPPG